MVPGTSPVPVVKRAIRLSGLIRIRRNSSDVAMYVCEQALEPIEGDDILKYFLVSPRKKGHRQTQNGPSPRRDNVKLSKGVADDEQASLPLPWAVE
jgi:hypothetical protein